MKKKNIGSTLDSLFDELEEREDVEPLTQKKLLAEKIERAMAKRNMFHGRGARLAREQVLALDAGAAAPSGADHPYAVAGPTEVDG